MDIETGTIIESAGSYRKVDPPFGYFGSKNKIALQLCKNLPPHYCWVEAFCGSAAVTLAKPPAPIEVINDKDKDIVNLFRQLRTNHEELCRQVALTPYASQELVDARLENNDDTDLEKARKFLVNSMMTINGILGEERGGFSSSNSYSRNNREARVNRWYKLPDRIFEVVERLRSVRIEDKDARELLKKFVNRPATLVYLDPPYLGERTNGYNIDANDEVFHAELLQLASEAKCMIFISGYENELYNSILSSEHGWEKRTIGAITKDSSGNSHIRTEVIWMNTHFIKAVNTKQVPIELTDREKEIRVINPERN